jgi:hypothetical protein
MMITPMAPAGGRRTSALSCSAAVGNVIARMAAIVPKGPSKLNLVGSQGPTGRESPHGQAAPDATAWAIRSPISLVE